MMQLDYDLSGIRKRCESVYKCRLKREINVYIENRVVFLRFLIVSLADIYIYIGYQNTYSNK